MIQPNTDSLEVNASLLKDLVSAMARSLVARPDLIHIDVDSKDDIVVIRLYTDPTDVSFVIGRQGRIARSLRTILGGASMKLGQRARLEIMNRFDPTGEVPSSL